MKVGYLGPIGSLYVQCNVGCFPDATLIPYIDSTCLKTIESKKWHVVLSQ